MPFCCSSIPGSHVFSQVLSIELANLDNIRYKDFHDHRASSYNTRPSSSCKETSCQRTYPREKLRFRVRLSAKFRPKKVAKIHCWTRIKSREIFWLDFSKTIRR